jgi:hypothetical protein
MQRVVGWIVLVPVVFLFFLFVAVALAAGAFLAGGAPPILPWNW